MARPLKPLVKSGGYYPSRKWTPLVYNGGYTTMDGGEEPTPVYWKTVTGVSPLALLKAMANPLKSLTQFGKCTKASTPTPEAPVDIMCNNGALRFGALGSNLLDPSASNTVLGYYINKADGVVKASPYNFMFAGYMPVEAGKTYVAYGRAKSDNDLSDYNRVAWYDSGKNWIEGASYTQNKIAIVTAPQNAAYARLSCNPSGGTSEAVTQAIVDSYNWMFAEGTAEITPFVPFDGGIYTDGTPEVLTVGDQTATVPDLYAVGDYKDEVDIISGGQVHKVGIKVLTSADVRSFSNGRWFVDVPEKKKEKSLCLCTHYVYDSGSASGISDGQFGCASTTRNFYFKNSNISDIDEAKTFVDDQFAAGTPIIVLYPLEEETTEQTTPQPLRTEAGDNTVSVVSEVDPVELSLEYAQPESGGS